MTDEDEIDSTSDDGGFERRVWTALDLLLSQAERILGEAGYNSPYDLLDSLNYLAELETVVQRELDYVVISLREHWRYGYDEIAYRMNCPWELDLSHLVVPIPDPEDMGHTTPRDMLSRYRAALKRQFGVARADVPTREYWDLKLSDINDRYTVIHGRSPYYRPGDD